jgi:hypothetical protein
MRTLLEILRREEYFFEDARGLAERSRVGEPESLVSEYRPSKLLTEIQRRFAKNCDCSDWATLGLGTNGFRNYTHHCNMS